MIFDDNFWFFAIPLGVVVVLFGVPLGVILRRMGFSVWWLLLFLVPTGIIVGMWLVAFVRWPAVARATDS